MLEKETSCTFYLFGGKTERIEVKHGYVIAQEEAEKDHNENLHNFLLRMQQVLLKLNPAEKSFKTPKVIFYGIPAQPLRGQPSPNNDRSNSKYAEFWIPL